MRIAIVHNTVQKESGPDERDVLLQAESIDDALAKLGHRAFLLGCDLNLAAVRDRLFKIRPDMVFNLVESLDGHDRLLHLFPALLESMGMPYTGSSSAALYFTSNKTVAKQRMLEAGLSTPPWIGPYPPGMPSLNKHAAAAQSAFGAKSGPAWLVKSLWQHASSGMHEDGLVLIENAGDIPELLAERAALLGGGCFAEAFIDGREFNLALLAGKKGPQVLPAAEIVFEDYPADKLQIVGYRAKWEKDSYEYRHTRRRFDFPSRDATLLAQLGQMAKTCWRIFALGGYARVDFRVDRFGQPWILEINTNPCLSPDAGFAAAVERAGLAFTDAVDRILGDTIARTADLC